MYVKPTIELVEATNGRNHVIKKICLPAKQTSVTILNDSNYNSNQFSTKEIGVIKNIEFTYNKTKTQKTRVATNFVDILKANIGKDVKIVQRIHKNSHPDEIVTKKGTVVAVFPTFCVLRDDKEFVVVLENTEEIISLSGKLNTEESYEEEKNDRIIIINYETKKDTFCYINETIFNGTISWNTKYSFVVDNENKKGRLSLSLVVFSPIRGFENVEKLVLNDRSDFKVIKQKKKVLFKKKKKEDEGKKELVAIEEEKSEKEYCSYDLGKIESIKIDNKKVFKLFEKETNYLEVYKCNLSNVRENNVFQIMRIINDSKFDWSPGEFEIYGSDLKSKEIKQISKKVFIGEPADITTQSTESVKVFYQPIEEKTDDMKKRGNRFFAKKIVKGRVQIVNLQSKPNTLFLSTFFIGKFLTSKEKCEMKETPNNNDNDVNQVRTDLNWVFVIKGGEQKRFSFKFSKWELLDGTFQSQQNQQNQRNAKKKTTLEEEEECSCSESDEDMGLGLFGDDDSDDE